MRGSDGGVGWRMWWSLDTKTQRLRTWARVGRRPSKFLMFGVLQLECSGDNRWRREWEERGDGDWSRGLRRRANHRSPRWG